MQCVMVCQAFAVNVEDAPKPGEPNEYAMQLMKVGTTLLHEPCELSQ